MPLFKLKVPYGSGATLGVWHGVCQAQCMRSRFTVDCSSGVALGSGLIISRYCSMGGLWVAIWWWFNLYAPPPLLRLARLHVSGLEQFL